MRRAISAPVFISMSAIGHIRQSLVGRGDLTRKLRGVISNHLQARASAPKSQRLAIRRFPFSVRNDIVTGPGIVHPPWYGRRKEDALLGSVSVRGHTLYGRPVKKLRRGNDLHDPPTFVVVASTGRSRP